MSTGYPSDTGNLGNDVLLPHFDTNIPQSPQMGGPVSDGAGGIVYRSDFGPNPQTGNTRIRQGDGIQDYSNYGWSQNLQDFFNQQQPADNGSWSYDIANKTFGKGGGMPGAGNQQSWYSDIPQDVMNQYVDSQKAQNDAYQNYYTNNPTPLQNENGSTNFGGLKFPELTDLSKYFHQTGGVQPQVDKGTSGLPSTPQASPYSRVNASDYEGLNFSQDPMARLNMPMFRYGEGASPEDRLRNEASYGTRDQYSYALNRMRTDAQGKSGFAQQEYDQYGNFAPNAAPTPTQTQTSINPTTSGLSTVINPNQQNTVPTQTTGGLSTVINPNQQNPVATQTTGGLSTGINPNQQNPVATPPTTPTPGPFIPNTGALAGVVGATTANTGANMALPSIFNPQVNPNVTQTQTAQTTAPDWYSNFLSGLSTSGQAAVNQGGIAPASTLQNLAYSTAPTAIGAGAPALAQATTAAGNVAATPTTSLIGNYMNPYTQSVVKSIGDLGTQQFREFTDPAMTSYGVATGQFGGSRAQDIRAKAARDAAMNITAQQTQAMNTGFNNALTAAQNQQNLGLNTANVLGNLSSQAQSQGIGGLNALSTLGGQQQTLSQAERNYPMTSLQNYANLMSGLNVPTGTTQTVTGPAGNGQMQTSSPLSQIFGLGTSGMALWNTKMPGGSTLGESILKSTPVDSILNYFKGKGGGDSGGSSGGSIDPTTFYPYDVGGSSRGGESFDSTTGYPYGNDTYPI